MHEARAAESQIVRPSIDGNVSQTRHMIRRWRESRLSTRVAVAVLVWIVGASLLLYSRKVHTDIVTAVVFGQMQSIHERYMRYAEELDTLAPTEVMFISPWRVTVDTAQVAQRVRAGLQYPFFAVRIDSASLRIVPDTVRLSDGKEYVSTEEFDLETGIPVSAILVGPVLRTGLRTARVWTVEWYWPLPHYMDGEWTVVWDDGQWRATHYDMQGIN